MDKRSDSSEGSRQASKANSRDRHSSKESHSSDRNRRHRSGSPKRERRRSRSPSRDRRRSRSPSRDRRRSRSPDFQNHRRRRHGSQESRRHEVKYDRHKSERVRRSRSRSLERAANRKRNKADVRKLMAKNYEEQMKKGPNNATWKQNASSDPSTLIQEIEKRKLLWSKKEKPADTHASSSTGVWEQTKFTGDDNGKVTEKFKRLMGIKNGDTPVASDKPDDISDKAIQNQESYFADLEKQYEVARATTHIQRGLGLGFSTRNYLIPKAGPCESKKDNRHR